MRRIIKAVKFLGWQRHIRRQKPKARVNFVHSVEGG